MIDIAIFDVQFVIGGSKCVCTNNHKFGEPTTFALVKGSLEQKSIGPLQMYNDGACIVQWIDETKTKTECVNQCCEILGTVAWAYGFGVAGKC